MTALSKPDFDPSRPFTVQQALAGGLTYGDLRTVRYRAIFPGIYVSAAVPITPRLRAEAALLAYPEPSYLSHVSGARVLGAPIPVLPDEHVTVLRPQLRHDRAGIVCHYVRRAQVILFEGLRVSGPEQLFGELAMMLTLVDLVVLGDYMVYKRWTSAGRLIEHAASLRGRGARPARRAAAYVRAKVESPQESRLRMLIVLAGLPEPQIQVRVVLNGQRRRLDLAYEQQRLAIEYDGRQHAEDEQWESDIERREALDDDAWRILVVLAKGIFTEPDKTLERIHERARALGVPGTPVRLKDDWRPHFPIR